MKHIDDEFEETDFSEFAEFIKLIVQASREAKYPAGVSSYVKWSSVKLDYCGTKSSQPRNGTRFMARIVFEYEGQYHHDLVFDGEIHRTLTAKARGHFEEMREVDCFSIGGMLKAVHTLAPGTYHELVGIIGKNAYAEAFLSREPRSPASIALEQAMAAIQTSRDRQARLDEERVKLLHLIPVVAQKRADNEWWNSLL